MGSPAELHQEHLHDATLSIDGMHCASCIATVERAAEGVPGVRSAWVNLASARAQVQYDPGQTDLERIAAAITASGYRAAPNGSRAATRPQEGVQNTHARAWLRRALAGLFLWLPLELVHWTLYLLSGHAHRGWMDWLALGTSTIAIVYIGRGFFAGAWSALRRGTSNMDTLIAMGASVAYLYSLVAFLGYQFGWWATLPHLYFMESTGLLALISLGHWLEARARHSAGSAIHQLLDLAPATAWRLDEQGEPQPAPVAELRVGDRVLVRPGDRIAIDGTVLEGRSSVDESMISGEALPVNRSPGDAVIGGTLNHEGRLIVRATQIGSDTALAQIVRLVEMAQSRKPPVQRLADRIAAVFVPTVLLIAVITGAAWYVAGTAYYPTQALVWGKMANAVCSVLLIACPCALGLAVPAALMVGTGRGARRGILIRDIDALQQAERIDTIVLDKTGTITLSKPVVEEITPLDGRSADEVLRLAAAAEQYSEHPLARAIVDRTRELGLPLTEAQEFTSHAGFGVMARVESQTVLVGNEALLAEHGAEEASTATHPDPSPDRDGRTAGVAGRTYVHVGRKSGDGSVTRLGIIAIADQLKPDSRTAVQELQRMRLRTVLLTGDNRATAESIAAQVGITDVRAEVLPQEKAGVIRALQAERRKVAMVGDGINDAPALATADLGIAIGSGSDIAKETGRIVLVSGSLHGVATSIRLSRATMKKIRQNLFFAFIYNVLAIPLAALGLLSPLIAAGAMALSDVTVIGNALLLRRTNID